MTTDRTKVERALYARAERLAEIERGHTCCYACGGDRFEPLAYGGLVLCVNCQEVIDLGVSGCGRGRPTGLRLEGAPV
jgi:hypothetical protein